MNWLTLERSHSAALVVTSHLHNKVIWKNMNWSTLKKSKTFSKNVTCHLLSKGIRKKIELIHTGETPYVCSNCGNALPWNGHLKTELMEDMWNYKSISNSCLLDEIKEEPEQNYMIISRQGAIWPFLKGDQKQVDIANLVNSKMPS